MIQPGYPAVLDLTRRMQRAANAQDWDELVHIEAERRSMLAQMASEPGTPRTDPVSPQQARVVIGEIERLDREIIEQVESWRNDVAALLGIRKE